MILCGKRPRTHVYLCEGLVFNERMQVVMVCISFCKQDGEYGNFMQIKFAFKESSPGYFIDLCLYWDETFAMNARIPGKPEQVATAVLLKPLQYISHPYSRLIVYLNLSTRLFDYLLQTEDGCHWHSCSIHEMKQYLFQVPALSASRVKNPLLFFC